MTRAEARALVAALLVLLTAPPIRHDPTCGPLQVFGKSFSKDRPVRRTLSLI
jgi:hypothetical protein